MMEVLTSSEVEALFDDPMSLAGELAWQRGLVQIAWDRMLLHGTWTDDEGKKIDRTNVQSAKDNDGTHGGDTTSDNKGYPAPSVDAKFSPNPDDLKIVSDLLKDTGLAHSRIIAANTSVAMSIRDKAALLKVVHEGIELFVQEEDRRAFVGYLRDRLLGGKELDERLLDVQVDSMGMLEEAV
jgi:hypothetical protein